MKPKVFLTAPLMPAAMDRLGSLCELTVHDSESTLTADRLRASVKDKDALICFLTDRIDADLFAEGNHLRVVANYAVGYNNMDLEAASEAGVWVTNTPGVLTESTADMTWALLMAVSRRIVEGDQLVRNGRWDGWQPNQLLGVELSGSTIGLIGLGRIAKAVAKRARGFGMKIVAWNRSPVDQDELDRLGVEMLSIDSLCERSDFVSLHCALTPETTHLLDRERLSRMQPSCIVLNTARGPCIDEAALCDALRTGQIRGAGLDVFEREPIVREELLAMKNVVLAPHLGSATESTRMAMANLAIDNVMSACRGETPPTPIQPRRAPQ